jgi:histidyl-tRNA synthetase
LIKAIRGFNDKLPEDMRVYQLVERHLRQLTHQYGYSEISLPLLESTELFSRTAGETSDVVNKEMYSFCDRNGDSVTLRPEGTAGCMRAVIEHHMTYGRVPRLFYFGPMFRYERPQKGRYRQFNHFGLEAFAAAGHELEGEQIALMTALWSRLGVSDKIKLQINSLGTPAVRHAHKTALLAYLEANLDQLDHDSIQRLKTNPLRILDSKNPDMRLLIEEAPKITDFFDAPSRQHFEGVLALLDQLGIAYEINPYLVRGLDYYCHTVFEWVSEDLGSQGTVCGGGRYDGLAEQLGAKPLPAVGLALGIERLQLLLSEEQCPRAPVAYAIFDPEATGAMMVALTRLREQCPGIRFVMHASGGSFKSQFKQANKQSADVALVMGHDELLQQKITVKFLKTDHPSEAHCTNDLAILLNTQLIQKGM